MRQSNKFYAGRGGNPSISAARGTQDAQEPDDGARLSPNPRKNFFLRVKYFTLLDRFLNEDA
jgi:hypothetical protein